MHMDVAAAAGVVGLPVLATDGLAVVGGVVVAVCANACDAKAEHTESSIKNFFMVVSGTHAMACLLQ